MTAPRPRLDPRGKVAVITGAASGIGEALALELAGRGSHIALVDVQAKALDEVAQQVIAKGVTASTHVVDVADIDALEALPAAVLGAHGAVDVLVNNAGVGVGGTIFDYSRDDIDWILDINVRGVLHGTRVFLPHLVERPIAQIANTSSIFGYISPARQALYAASKFAVRGYSNSLRLDLADTPVGVTSIHPGGIQTAIARNARPAAGVTMSAEEQAKRIRWTEKQFMTSPEAAGRVIANAIEARRPRVFIGRDAYVMAALERLFPVYAVDVITRFVPLI